MVEPSKVGNGLSTIPYSILKSQDFDLGTRDLVNTHYLHSDLCYSSLNLALLDGFIN